MILKRMLSLGLNFLASLAFGGHWRDGASETNETLLNSSICTHPTRHFSQLYYHVSETGAVSRVFTEPLCQGEECGEEEDCSQFPFELCGYPGADWRERNLTCSCSHEGMIGTDMNKYHLKGFEDLNFPSYCRRGRCRIDEIYHDLIDNYPGYDLNFLASFQGFCVREFTPEGKGLHGCDFKWRAPYKEASLSNFVAMRSTHVSRAVVLLTEEEEEPRLSAIQCRDFDLCNDFPSQEALRSFVLKDCPVAPSHPLPKASDLIANLGCRMLMSISLFPLLALV